MSVRVVGVSIVDNGQTTQLEGWKNIRLKYKYLYIKIPFFVRYIPMYTLCVYNCVG